MDYNQNTLAGFESHALRNLQLKHVGEDYAIFSIAVTESECNINNTAHGGLIGNGFECVAASLPEVCALKEVPKIADTRRPL